MRLDHLLSKEPLFRVLDRALVMSAGSTASVRGRSGTGMWNIDVKPDVCLFSEYSLSCRFAGGVGVESFGGGGWA